MDGGGVATCRELVLDYVNDVTWRVNAEIGNDYKQVSNSAQQNANAHLTMISSLLQVAHSVRQLRCLACMSVMCTLSCHEQSEPRHTLWQLGDPSVKAVLAFCGARHQSCPPPRTQSAAQMTICCLPLCLSLL